MDQQKMLPVGLERFEEIRAQGFYYVDKTGLIKDLLEHWGKVNLFTRPRRFGKSLNMSMLKSFFEIGCNRALFDGLEIAREHDLCEEYMGQFPVISVTFKGVSGADYAAARAMMCSLVGMEALRFGFLLDSDRLMEQEKARYRSLIMVQENGEFGMSDELLVNAFLTLTQLLEKHYGRQVILLIDEYDVPLDKAYQMGYYDDMVNLIRNMFVQALKTNDSLKFAVLTGCLRVSKESIFTGLNNLRVLSITDSQMDEYFGFTDREVRELLAYYGLGNYYGIIREWYDGYRFGNAEVYCPWDVICYCSELLADPGAFPKEYWSHTSGNGIIRGFIDRATKKTRNELEKLIAGETIRKTVRQNITYNELDLSIDNLWSVLFMTGYLTQRAEPQEKETEKSRTAAAGVDIGVTGQMAGVYPEWGMEDDVLTLAIPNREIRKLFVTQIYAWFQETARKDTARLDAFCLAFRDGDPVKAEEMFNAYLMRTISIRDTGVRKAKKENFYQGILLGLLSHMEEWDVSSNRESGEGYSDILVEIEEEEIGIVIEMKYAEQGNMETGCEKALQQIEDMHYEQALREDGMKTILKYGIACFRKKCRVVLKKEEGRSE